MSSGAIVRTDDIDYENYRRKKEATLRQNKMIEEQKKEIESLKSDLDEIKQMLNVILKAHR